MNQVEWNKKALKKTKTFPREVKKELGYLIYKLQIDEILGMPKSKMMPAIGKSCYELRVKGIDGIYRAFYFLKIKGEVLIFHAFQKKSQKTTIKEIGVGKKNLKEMLNEKE